MTCSRVSAVTPSADPYGAWRHDPDRYEGDPVLCPDCGAELRPLHDAWVCDDAAAHGVPVNVGVIYSHRDVGLVDPADCDDNGPRDERRAVRDAAMGRNA